MTEQTKDQDVELNDELEEAHDPKNAEAQSIASADTATDAGPTAKEPGGKGLKAEPMPKTKAGIINAMFSKLNSMPKASLAGMYGTVMGEDVKVEIEDEKVELTSNEDIDALIKSEDGLSEGFKEKAAVIFEAAVNSKVADAAKAKEADLEAEVAVRVEAMEEQYKSDIEDGLNEARDELVGKIDSYLNYVVETWMTENRLAVEKGLRTEIAETFMNNLKDLFTESYIQVPESKVDLVDDLVEQVEELEDQLNKSTEQAMHMKAEGDDLRRSIVIKNASKDLAETQIAKLEKLAEGIDFEDEETFAKKVATLKDSYFSETPEKAVEAQAAEKVNEATEEDATEEVEVNSVMEKYLTAIRNSN